MTQADCVWNKSSLTNKGRGIWKGQELSTPLRDNRYADSPKIPDICTSHHPSSLLLPAGKKQAGVYAWERTRAHGCAKQESSETRGSKADEGLIHPVARGNISDRAELLTAISKFPLPLEKPHSDALSSLESKEAEGYSPDRALCQAGSGVYSSQELSTVLREDCLLWMVTKETVFPPSLMEEQSIFQHRWCISSRSLISQLFKNITKSRRFSIKKKIKQVYKPSTKSTIHCPQQGERQNKFLPCHLSTNMYKYVLVWLFGWQWEVKTPLLILRAIYTWIAIVYAQVRRNKRKSKQPESRLCIVLVSRSYQSLLYLVSKIKRICLTTYCIN